MNRVHIYDGNGTNLSNVVGFADVGEDRSIQNIEILETPAGDDLRKRLKAGQAALSLGGVKERDGTERFTYISVVSTSLYRGRDAWQNVDRG